MFRREGRQIQFIQGARIGGQRAISATLGQDTDAVPFRQFAVTQRQQQRAELYGALNLQRAALFESRLIDLILPGEGSGVA